MAKVSTNVSLDADIKKQAQELFSQLGMDLSTAINIFLRQSLRQHSIPFEITTDVPNADTIAAMKEIEQMKLHPERYKKYHSFADAVADIELGEEVNNFA